MTHVVFETQIPTPAIVPNRADVACFVGFVAQRPDALVPVDLRRWLNEQGWTASFDDGDILGADFDLSHKPVPIESWDRFDQLFRWDERAPEGVTTYLGAAVRSFFAQGGRTCYIVSVDEPWAIGAGREERLARLAELIPGYPDRLDVSAVDRESWRGIAALLGLPDVSLLILPDLVDALGIDRPPIETETIPHSGVEVFVECSGSESPPSRDTILPRIQAPRCDADGYRAWFQAIRLITSLIETQRRDMQLVVSLPIPANGSGIEVDVLAFLLDDGGQAQGPLAVRRAIDPNGLATAFVQLAYPWVRSPGSWNLPEQLESPDAVLAGVLARNALTRGAWFSAADSHLADVYDVAPALSREKLLMPRIDNLLSPSLGHSLIERVSLLGQAPLGLRVLSDVTTSLDDAYRPACVCRLVSVVTRAVEQLGEESVFEPSGEALWTRIETRLGDLMNEFFEAGALGGQTRDEAFEVRCGRETMTQNDIDSGRIIASVSFIAALPIDQITVVFALTEGGRVAPTQVGAA